MSKRKIADWIFLSANPAVMVALFFYSGGWIGVLLCLAMFAALGFLFWMMGLS